jgi:predicted nucleotidyltransferase
MVELIEKSIEKFKEQHPNKRILKVIQIGSHLFKLNTPNSDIDILGIYLPEKMEFLTGKFSKEITYNSNTQNIKNTNKDIDCKFISIFRFFELLKKGEFNSLEWLYAPEYATIYQDDVWNLLVDQYKDRLVIFNISSFLGFIKTEQKSALLNGNSLIELETIRNDLQQHNNQKELKIVISSLLKYPFVKQITSKINNERNTKEIESILVANRIYQGTMTIGYTIKEINKILENNKPSHRKNSEGIDTKGLYHIQRLLYEAKDLLTNRAITIPFSEDQHLYLSQIRKGVINLEDQKILIENQISEIKKLELNFTNFNSNLYNIEKLEQYIFGHYNILSKIP